MASAANGTEAVVITGASTGIGEACALRLDKLGFRVFAGVRKEEDGERLRQQASERLTPIMLDVTNQAGIESAAASVGGAVGDGGLAGLVNNAGISINGPLEFLTPEDLRRQRDQAHRRRHHGLVPLRLRRPRMRRGHPAGGRGAVSGQRSAISNQRFRCASA